MYERVRDNRANVEKYVPKNVPIYDPKLHEFETPEQLKVLLDNFSFSREFIDWVVEQGYKIVYYSPRKKRRQLGQVWLDSRTVYIYQRDIKSKRETLAHELIHIAVPDSRLAWGYILSTEFNRQLQAYEDVIDQAGFRFVQDKELMTYAQDKIPTRRLSESERRMWVRISKIVLRR